MSISDSILSDSGGKLLPLSDNLSTILTIKLKDRGRSMCIGIALYEQRLHEPIIKISGELHDAAPRLCQEVDVLQQMPLDRNLFNQKAEHPRGDLHVNLIALFVS